MLAKILNTHWQAAWLAGHIRPFRRDFLIAIACSLASGLLASADPLLLKILLDDVLPAKSFARLVAIILGFSIATLGRSALTAYGGWAGVRATQRTALRLRVSAIRKLNRLAFPFHRRSPAGDTFFRIERDIEQIAEGGGSLILQGLAFLVSTSAMICLLLWLSPLMTLMLIPLNLTFWLVRKRLRPQLQEFSTNVQIRASEAAAALQEHLWALPQFQLLGCERTEARRLVGKYAGRLRLELDRRKLESKIGFGVSTGVALSTTMILALGGYQVMRDALTVGSLVACYGWMARLFDPISVGFDMYVRATRVGVCIQRLRELLDTDETITEGAAAPNPEEIRGSIKLSRVSFSYENGPTIFKDVNVVLQPGERVALLGPSGIGKSTLGRIVVRMELDGGGSILLDNRDIRQYKLSNLRSHICYLPQEALILDRSIRANLLLGNLTSGDAELWRALRSVHLEDVVRAMPNGLKTRAGPMGCYLSGGERQRLVLARHLLRRPKILILDEPTCALDEATEADVLSELFRAFSSQTILLITHRRSCIRWVDRILCLDDGRVRENRETIELSHLTQPVN